MLGLASALSEALANLAADEMIFDFGRRYAFRPSVDLGLPVEDDPGEVGVVEISPNSTDLAILGAGFFIVQGEDDSGERL